MENSYFDVIAIAASAGGLKAIEAILSTLPASFPTPIVIVQHLHPDYPSFMSEILGNHTVLKVAQAHDHDRIAAGCVYIAPPDQHLLVNPDRTLTLTHSERVHFVRPAADLLFESAAAGFKERLIAIVLTGTGRDGARGVEAVKKNGGTVLVQDQASSEFFGMPNAAIHTGFFDRVLPLGEISETLTSLVTNGNC